MTGTEPRVAWRVVRQLSLGVCGRPTATTLSRATATSIRFPAGQDLPLICFTPLPLSLSVYAAAGGAASWTQKSYLSSVCF